MKASITFDRLRWEEKALKDAASSAGLDMSLVDVKEMSFLVSATRPELGAIVLQRCISHYRSLMTTLAIEGSGTPVINRLAVAETCSNKLAASIALSKARVPTPRTIVAMSSDAVERAADELGFPLVLKPFSGSWGRMVSVVKDNGMLQSLVEYKEELGNPLEHMYYLQELVKRPPRDIRAIVAGEELVACVHRYAPDGEWRTNVARGGTSKAFKPDSELKELVHKASEAVGGGVLGVDAMESPEGYMVHEVNNTVEFKGAQSAVKVDIPERIVRYVAETARR